MALAGVRCDSAEPGVLDLRHRAASARCLMASAARGGAPAVLYGRCDAVVAKKLGRQCRQLARCKDLPGGLRR